MFCPSLRIRGQLPAPIVNGWGDSFRKWKDLPISRARDLDLGSGHTAYWRALLIDLYLHTKFHWKWRNFLRIYGRTYGHFETHFIRSSQKSPPKNPSDKPVASASRLEVSSWCPDTWHRDFAVTVDMSLSPPRCPAVLSADKMHSIRHKNAKQSNTVHLLQRPQKNYVDINSQKPNIC